MKPPEPTDPFKEPIKLDPKHAGQDGEVIDTVKCKGSGGVNTSIPCIEPHDYIFDDNPEPKSWHPFPAYKLRKKPPMPLEPFKTPIKLDPESAKQDGPIMVVVYPPPPPPDDPSSTYCGSRLRVPKHYKIGKKAA